MTALDPRQFPDPRYVPEDDDVLWDPANREWVPRPSGLVALLTGLTLGVVIGFLFAVGLVHATPRSAPEPVVPAAVQGRSGAPPELPHVAPSSAARAMSATAERTAAPTSVTEPPAMSGGLASYCAPTPTKCQSWGGDAHLGAVPSFRYGDRPYRVTVCRQDDSTVCTRVRIVSFCACGRFLIDLSPAAFRELAPLSRGTVPVTVEDVAGPGITPPPTDTSEGAP